MQVQPQGRTDFGLGSRKVLSWVPLGLNMRTGDRVPWHTVGDQGQGAPDPDLALPCYRARGKFG
jgi:hypothetical protein